MNDGAGDGEFAKLFEGFVEDVAGIEIRSDEDVGFPFYGALWSFLASDGGIHGSVELHFAVDEPIGMVLFDLVDDVMNLVEVRVFSAGTIGGVGKHGDAGLGIGEGSESDGGIFDNDVELFFGRDFVDAAVGEG